MWDNVKVIAPSGELSTKLADKVADAEAEIEAKADKLKGLLDKVDLKPIKMGE